MKEMKQIRFKKLDYSIKDKDGVETIKQSNGVLPKRKHITDAGYDLMPTRLTQELDDAGKVILVYHTDIAVEIPEGYVGLLFMRSSVATKSLVLTNAVGVIDSGYRGELMCKFKITTDALPRVYQMDEAMAQLLILPYLEFEPVLVDELEVSDRGTDGYGSTDNIKQDEYTEDKSVEGNL